MTLSDRCSSAPSIMVIGGGIIARTCALELQKQGCNVTLLHKPEQHPASWGNAGHIATEQIIPLAHAGTVLRLVKELFPRGPVDLAWSSPSVWLPWAARFMASCLPFRVKRGRSTLKNLLADALPAWERLTQNLNAPELLDLAGTVKLWERTSTKAENALRSDFGTVTTTPIAPAELQRINDALQPPMCAGVHFAQTAHITDPTRLLALCLERFQERGGRVIESEVISVDDDANGATITTNEQVYQADYAVVACGVLSAHLTKNICPTPMIAERGYHVEWDHGGAWPLPNVVFEDRSLVVTRFGKRLRTTSFVEFTRHNAEPDVRKWAHLIAHIRELGLPVASDFTYWHGSRPTLPDYLPALGAFSAHGKLFAAYGHNHLGLTLAATTAEKLAQNILHNAPLPHALRPQRFKTF